MVSDEEIPAESSELEEEIKEDKASKTKFPKDKTKSKTVSNGAKTDPCEDYPIYQTPLLGQDMTQDQFLSEV